MSVLVRASILLYFATAIAAAAACSAENSARDVAIPDPDLSQMEPQVAALLKAERERLLQDPQSAEAWGGLGAAYDAHLLAELAEVAYKRAHELAPDDFRWLYLLAVVREINGAEAPELRGLFERALEMRPDYVACRIRLGDALSRRGLLDLAREQFRLALVEAPGSAVAQRGMGQVLLQQGDAAGALEPLTRATRIEPLDRLAWTALAQAQSAVGQAAAAAESELRAKALEPESAIDDPVYHTLVSEKSVASSRVFRRGILRYRRADYAPAVADFEQVAAVRPDDPSVLFWLGSTLNHLGRQGDAVTPLARAIEIDPSMVRARSALAEAYFTLGRYDEAEAQYEAALGAGADAAAAWLALAEVRMRQNDVEGVVLAYTKAAASRPLDAREEMNFGVALMSTDRPGQAIEHFRRSLELKPGNANLHYNLGVAHRMLGENDAATAEFERAVAIDPTHRAAQELARGQAP